MTLSKDTMLEIMAYADGELEPEERARIEKLVAENADAQRLFDSIEVLGRVVERIHDASHASAYEGIADDVMARVEKEGAPRKSSIRPPKVIDFRDAREKRVKLAAAVVAVVALAAGIVLTTRRANETTPVASSSGTNQAASPNPAIRPAGDGAEPRAQMAALGPAAAGVDVDQVDTKNDVQVFYLPSTVGENASSVIVWIDDKASAP